MQKRLRLIHPCIQPLFRGTALLLCLLSAGCAELDFSTLNLLQKIQMSRAHDRAEELRAEARYLEASQVLWAAASNLPPPDREKMQLESARALIEGNHLLNANRKLAAIDEKLLRSGLLLDKRVLQAQFFRQSSQPEEIIALLPARLIQTGGKTLKIQALELRADALADTHRYLGSVAARVQLAPLLKDPGTADDNTMKLWRTLATVEPGRAAARMEQSENPRFRAWLELTTLTSPAEVDRAVLNQAYADWRKRNYFLHVPDAVYEELSARWEYLDFHPQQIALLLPLTGDYAKIGRVIEQGFIAARDAAEKPFEFQIYNTDQDRNITQIYRKAVEQGADTVIGPLIKSKVSRLLETAEFSVQTITLNYHPDTNFQPRGELFQFGLLPEDDAAQVAAKIYDKGHRYVAVLAPDDEWGERLYRKFTDSYTELGGHIRETGHYSLDFQDYATVVQSLLKLNESRRRHRQVEDALGKKVEFKPRIRDDISAAVLFANHEKAALIYPLLKFYYADKLPVFATSHVYAPGREKILRELDGLIYCDIPFMIENEQAEMPESASEYPRLFALGMDAYRLINLIRRITISDIGFDGATGHLSADERFRVFRQLAWARFEKGKPVAFGRGW